MANKGFFGSLIFLAALMFALLSMCWMGSAQGVAATRNEVLTSYLGHTGLHAVVAMRSGKYSRVSFVCGDKQWDLRNDYTRSPSEYFMSFLSEPSKELRISLTPYDCIIVPRLISSFDSGKKRLNCPALWHLALHLGALEHLPNKLSAASRFSAELANSWQTPCLAYAVAIVYDDDSSIPRALREKVVEITVQHYTELFESKDDRGLFSLAFREFPAFAADVSRARAESDTSQSGR
ncbi:hypothetical protein LTR10_003289 [Elasticomyces elasticus]|nr:hypothetical protein LTR10_003289 [Elasticomyces elasticus]KAK4969560.1 hypothetical protein LTR42_008831 [Elasticomyces elasticus]